MFFGKKSYANGFQYWIGCPGTNKLFQIKSFLLYKLHFFRYTSEDAAGDIVAGITVGLTIIPQALAYSGIAGLDPEVSSYIVIKYLPSLQFYLSYSSASTVHSWAALSTFSSVHAKTFPWARQQLPHCLHSMQQMAFGNGQCC